MPAPQPTPAGGWVPPPLSPEQREGCYAARDILAREGYDTTDFVVWWWQYSHFWSVALCYLYPHLRPVGLLHGGNIIHTYAAGGGLAYDALGVHRLPYRVADVLPVPPMQHVWLYPHVGVGTHRGDPTFEAALRVVLRRAKGPQGVLGN